MSGARAVEAFRFFTERGWSPEAASAIVGPMYQESGFRTTARNPGDGRDGSDSIGINQWNSGRARNLQTFARVNGYNPTDFQTQLAFTDWELRNDERRVGERLSRVKSPDEAAAIMAGYHRPAGWTANNPMGAHGFANRLSATRDIYRAFQATGGGAPQPQAAVYRGGAEGVPAEPAVMRGPMPGRPQDYVMPAAAVRQTLGPDDGWEDVPAGVAAAGGPAIANDEAGWEDVPDPQKSEGMAGRATRAQREYVEPVNPMTAAMRGAAQGASFGFGDEISGLAAASGTTARAAQENARAVGLPNIPSPIDVGAGAIRMGLEKLAPSWFGNKGNEAYDQSVGQTRADLSSAQMQQPVATVAGQVVGGLAVPVPVGAMATPGRAAATGAGMAAAYGVGEGITPQDRLEKGALGAVVGAPAGYAVGRILAPSAPKAPTEIVRAADNIGVQVPRGLASEITGAQALTQTLRGGAGGSMVENAVKKTVNQLDEAAQRVAAQAGGRETGVNAPNAYGIGEGIQGEIDAALSQVRQTAQRDATRLQNLRGDDAPSLAQAGGAVRDRITANVAENKEIADAPYKALEAVLPMRGMQPEAANEAMQGIADGLNRVIRARAASGETGIPSALQPAMELATRPEGVTFAGLQRARQKLSEQIDFEAGRGFGTGDLKDIYGKMTGTMREIVVRQGGERALKAFDAAELQFAAVQARNAELNNALRGKDEGFITGLISSATEKTGANAAKFMGLWRELGDAERQTVANAIYGRLGRAQGGAGEFSIDTFAKNWQALSGPAKSQMFGKQAAEIDRLLTTAQGSSARSAEYAKDIIKLTQDAPERVVDRLLSAASSGAGEDFGKLARAVTVMGPKATRELADTMIGQLGRHSGQYSPRRFVSDWGNIPDSAKRLLIPDAAHRAALDDIAKVSGRMADSFERFASKSQSNRGVMIGMAGSAGYFEPMTLLGTVVAPTVMSKILSTPAGAASASKWARAVEVYSRQATAATATALDRATRNFASTVGESAGVPDLAGALMGQLTGGVADDAGQVLGQRRAP